MKPIVIALCGPPGSGKSTLMRTIAALRPAYPIVDYDAFPNATARPFRDIKAWFERSADPNEFLTPELEAHLEARTKPNGSGEAATAVLFETPFGRTHRQTGRFIDFLVWVDIPLEIALARQISAMCQQRKNPTLQEYEAFISGLEVFLQNYTEIIVEMYKRQAIEVRAGADLIVDGLKSPAELAETVLAAAAACDPSVKKLS
ncbi:hypothetical protein [Methyloferula stellata]|uniref:hypothetical protein n=1 Tax=Methyloferula stellata TaxID=876270 RepID=UPI00036A9B2E|nr:hypothetical protein [Methyloferula stellata]